MSSNHGHTDTRSPVRPNVAIILNPAAGGGTALGKWATIREVVLPKFGTVSFDVLDESTSVDDVVGLRFAAGYTRFVAAGGDGTVNALLQALMSRGDERFQLGAIALGSSNDYHKPVTVDRQVSGIPCRCNFETTGQRDVGVLRFEDETGVWQTRYWLINAGMGITAEANALFNNPDPVLLELKRRSTSAAIFYAALLTIMRYHKEKRSLKVASLPWMSAPVTNLGIVKSPHFSGSLCYDTPFIPDNGRFHVHLCADMSFTETVHTLWQLAHQRFTGLPHTQSWQANRLSVAGDEPFRLEYDGEIVSSKRVQFSLATRRLEVCVG